MKKLASLLLLALAAGSAFAQGARPADVATVDSIVAALYDTISGPAGKVRDWDRLRSLFRNDGRMVVHSTGKDGAINTRVLSIEDYIARTTPVFAKEGFYESELARKSEEFGQIADLTEDSDDGAEYQTVPPGQVNPGSPEQRHQRGGNDPSDRSFAGLLG